MTTEHTANSLVLSARHLHKSFGPVAVLKDIDLEIRAGEVLAILGENGAGKSTLMKILAGFEEATSGELRLHLQASAQDQLEQSPQAPTHKQQSVDSSVVVTDTWLQAQAEGAGVILIHQELNLADQLTVAENIFLGHELTRGPFLDKRAMRDLSRQYLDTLECAIDPDTVLGSLPVSARQMVEIAKTQARQTRVLLLDEPTAVLTQNESRVLFNLIERLRQQGVAIVYISHKLDEIQQIANRITILRDGTLVGHYQAADLSTDDMARLMVGRELSSLFPPRKPLTGIVDTVLSVSQLQVAGTKTPIDFSLRRGEVLGFSGLVGSGRTALMETIVGLRRPARSYPGHIQVHGKTVKLGSLAQARTHNIAYLTKDRKGSGLLLDKGLALNFSLFALHKFARVLINQQKEHTALNEAVATFDIRVKDERVLAGNMSGGNQQRLLLAKILAAEPSILIIDEPTRGIDIGTKGQLYEFIAKLAESGHAIILVSSDITEIIGMSDRVAVMYHGELTGILAGDEIEEHEIMRYATGLKSRQPTPVQPLRSKG